MKTTKYYGVYSITRKLLGHQCAYNGIKLIDGTYMSLFLLDKNTNTLVRCPWDNNLTQRDIKAFIKGYLWQHPNANFEYIESIYGDEIVY